MKEPSDCFRRKATHKRHWEKIKHGEFRNNAMYCQKKATFWGFLCALALSHFSPSQYLEVTLGRGGVSKN